MSEFEAITTQEAFDAAIGARLKRERETIEKKYDGYLSPEAVTEKYKDYLSPEAVTEKYKDYLSPADAAEKDKKLRAYETSSVKMRIAHENGIPFELAEKLSGDDEAAIRKDAEVMSKFLKGKKAQPLADPEGDPGNSKKAAMRKMLAGLKGE